MSGYYKRERSDVFDDSGWFHTGDRVTMINGVPWFKGRYKEMIKTQGANVSPREVELVLEGHPDVREAIVVAVTTQPHGESVAAVLVWEGVEGDTDSIREFARTYLSSFKIPRVIVGLHGDEIPLLGSGKPDKLRIAAMIQNGVLISAETSTPRGE